ncbi:MAG: 4-hydroxy-3-methylbut-2-enyl diphosphate reductase [Spirochaetia bacterium]|jgi:4-hydroxy-3-methylbut-2-enyl diphosphate reductase|nr:4-hydroxy-3-methylbut-2-enyl diphosphate reductase [Spirochaetia bacterium]
MKIELAKHSGFCFGVKNSIVRVVEEINSSEDTILVYGPLIHNPQTVEILENRGLKTVHSLDEISGSTVAVRTHGVPLDELRAIREQSSKILNLTCPRVARVQSTIRSHSAGGCHTIIIGDACHAEVVGLKSFSSAGVSVISSLDELASIPKADKYLLVSQTTLDRGLFEAIVKELNALLPNLTVVDTICDSTGNRQSDVHAGIKKGIDTLIVVGGKNSANTTMLASIGHKNGVKTFHIETEKELSFDSLKDSKHVLVTAGASTPGWIINNVLEMLYNIKYQRSNPFFRTIKMLLEFLVRANILSAVFAFFSTLFIQSAGIFSAFPSLPIISMLYIFSMYSTNNYFDRDFLKASNSYKYKIYRKYGNQLMVLSLVFLLASFYLIRDYSPLLIALLALSSIFGLVYFTHPVKKIIDALKVPFIKKIYGSKIVTSIGWLTVVVIVPGIHFHPDKSLLFFTASLILCLITQRHLIMGIVAYQGDFIFGRMNLSIWLGSGMTKILNRVFVILTFLACAWAVYQTGYFTLSILLVPLIYYSILLKITSRIEYPVSLRYEILTDINFIIAIACFVLVMNINNML